MRCERCDNQLEGGVVAIVMGHHEVYCWPCVSVVAQEAVRATQESLSEFEA